jgi:AraC family transcriptional regulator
MSKYQDIYPSEPLIKSADLPRQSASDLLSLEYFEADPGSMPTQKFAQHHIMINLNDNPHRVENLRDGEPRDLVFRRNEIVVTPAGIESGWTWHEKSKVIVITLEPSQFEAFAQNELGVLLTGKQLSNIPQFEDSDLTLAAENLLAALQSKQLGYEVMFESFSRIFLIRLIQKYREKSQEGLQFKAGFTSAQYKKVLDFVKDNFGSSLSLEDLAKVAGISPHRFSRLFKETIGKSPMQFVLSHRLDEARKLLVDHRLTLLNAAPSPIRPICPEPSKLGLVSNRNPLGKLRARIFKTRAYSFKTSWLYTSILDLFQNKGE